jgi:DNA-binding winged helix-turn-helix (wHTH) protein
MLEFPAVIEFGEYRLDRESRSLWRNSEPVKITAKPFELLEFLIVNHDVVVSKEELLQRVWDGPRDPNVVDQTIRQVRQALKANPNDPPFIVTVPGAGYRFVAPLAFPDDRTLAAAKAGDPGGVDATLPPAHDGPVPISAGMSASQVEQASKVANACKNPRRLLKYLAMALLGAAGAGAFLYATAPGQPAACEISVNTLIVKDGQGRELWSREFPQGLNRVSYAAHPPLCRFVDLDNDGVEDVLFAFTPAASDFDSDTLYGFLTRPRILRRLMGTPSRTLTFAPGTGLVVGPNSNIEIAKKYDEYLPPYSIAGVFAHTNKDGQVRVIVSSAMGQAPDQIAVLDGGFKKIGEYWHSGVLKYGQFARWNGHDRIFLGGVNNGYRSATLVAFDPNNVRGGTDLSLSLPDRMPVFTILATGTKSRLSPPGLGTETCRVLFQRTCVAKTKPHWEPYNRLIGLTVTEDRITVRVAEGEKEEMPETVVYELDRHLNLIEAAPTTQFRQRHFELERAGLLDHPFSIQEFKPLIRVLPGCEFVENAP